jgi:putative transposase
VNDKRVERIWRREGLQVPAKQPKPKRLWLNDGSCIRLRAERRNHVWSYDFMEHRINSTNVIDVPSDLFILRGVPEHIRSDNGPKFVAKVVRSWIGAVGAKTAYIEPGSPWENGFVESFNARLSDELSNGELFYSLKEAQVIIESWRRHYNGVRPHTSLGYQPPAPETWVPSGTAWPSPPTGAAPTAPFGQVIRPMLH